MSSDTDGILIAVDISEGYEDAPYLIVDISIFIAHLALSGISRMGKSRLACSIVLQLLSLGIQVIVIDPHGTMYRLLFDYAIENRLLDDLEMRQKIWFVNLPKATEELNI